MMADEPMAGNEPMNDRWLEIFRREIALAFGTHHSGPVADAVTRNAEKDLFFLIEQYQRLRAREAAAMAIVRAVAEARVIRPLHGEVEFQPNVDVTTIGIKARALLEQDEQ